MIKINLLGETRRIDPTRGFWILGIILLVVFGTLGGLGSIASVSSQVDELKSETGLLRAQLANVKKLTKTVSELDKKRKDLTEKLRIISVLRRSKTGPVRLLDDVNLSIPERSWLTAMKESEGALAISGVALDNQTVGTFIGDLAKSEYVESVDLVESRNAKKDGRDIKAFTLNAKIHYGGKTAARAEAEAKAKQEQEEARSRKNAASKTAKGTSKSAKEE